MRIKIGNLDCIPSINGITPTIVYSPSDIPFLESGDIQPSFVPDETQLTEVQKVINGTYSWSRFEDGGNDGYGKTLSANTQDARILDSRVPARFITPYQAEADRTEYVDVVVHPYPGTNVNDEENTFDVFFYLNGGPPVQGVKRTLNTGLFEGLNVYSAKVPSNLPYEVNEVRAVVMPQFGRPAILQAAGMLSPDIPTDLDAGAWDYETEGLAWQPGFRGTLLINYTDVVMDTKKSVHQMVSDEGTSAIRIDVSSVYTEQSRDAFYEAAWRRNNGAASGPSEIKGNPYIPMPVVINGHFYAAADTGITNHTSVVFRDCSVVFRPEFMPLNVQTGAEPVSYFIKGNAPYRPLYAQFDGCSFNLEKNTTYSGATTATALGQSILSDGFGVLLDAYDRGLSHENFSFQIVDNTGLGQYVTFFNSSAKYIALPGQEHVNCGLQCPAPTKDDAFGRTYCLVSCRTYGGHKSMYPWASIGANQIDYDFDWTSYEDAAAIQQLPNSGNLTPEAGPTSSFKTQLDAMHSSLILGDALNLGVWPDYYTYATIDTDGEFESLYYDSQSGIYTDHYGIDYASTWPKTWKLGRDDHYDILMLFGVRPGIAITANVRCYGPSSSYQALYYSNVVLDSVGAWDFVTVETASQVAIRLGAETRDGTADYQNNPPNFPRGNDSQFFGPGIYLLDPITLQPANQPISQMIRGDPDLIRGFSYVGDPKYSEPQDAIDQVYVAVNAVDDGISKVRQSTDDDPNDNEQTNNWWVVNLSR